MKMNKTARFMVLMVALLSIIHCKGNSGSSGKQGPQGVPGVQGIQGIQGPVGPQGLPGSTMENKHFYKLISPEACNVYGQCLTVPQSPYQEHLYPGSTQEITIATLNGSNLPTNKTNPGIDVPVLVLFQAQYYAWHIEAEGPFTPTGGGCKIRYGYKHCTYPQYDPSVCWCGDDHEISYEHSFQGEVYQRGWDSNNNIPTSNFDQTYLVGSVNFWTYIGANYSTEYCIKLSSANSDGPCELRDVQILILEMK